MASNLTQIAYTLCNTPGIVASATTKLSSAAYLAFDCEGRLGEGKGRLSVISLATLPATDPHAYLFDAIALTSKQLNPVFKLLQSQDHTKIMFDGRMDFSQLYHYHNTCLTTVLDLQLADVESRSRRGEGLNEQLQRLFPFVTRNEITRQQSSYTQIHRLNGLASCAKEHGVVACGNDAKPLNFTHTAWADRPLSAAYLQYAAGDIQTIARVYSTFLEKGYIDEPSLLQQSERYVSLRRDSLKDPGGGHSLLPLEILSPPASSDPKHACSVCKRSLSTGSFSNAKKKCWVCRAVALSPVSRRKARKSDKGGGSRSSVAAVKVPAQGFGVRAPYSYQDWDDEGEDPVEIYTTDGWWRNREF